MPVLPELGEVRAARAETSLGQGDEGKDGRFPTGVGDGTVGGVARSFAPPAAAPDRMSEAEFRLLRDRLRHQLPWGPEDRLGALNYITPADRVAAAGEVRLGRGVSLGASVEDRVTRDNPDPARHQMKGPLGAEAGPGLNFSMDRIVMPTA